MDDERPLSNWFRAGARCPHCHADNVPGRTVVVELTPMGAGYCNACGKMFAVTPDGLHRP